jgi:hypothetical protein
MEGGSGGREGRSETTTRQNRKKMAEKHWYINSIVSKGCSVASFGLVTQNSEF